MRQRRYFLLSVLALPIRRAGCQACCPRLPRTTPGRLAIALPAELSRVGGKAARAGAAARPSHGRSAAPCTMWAGSGALATVHTKLPTCRVGVAKRVRERGHGMQHAVSSHATPFLAEPEWLVQAGGQDQLQSRRRLLHRSKEDIRGPLCDTTRLLPTALRWPLPHMSRALPWLRLAGGHCRQGNARSSGQWQGACMERRAVVGARLTP